MSTAVPKEALRTLFASLAALPVASVMWEGEPKAPVSIATDGQRLILNVVARRGVGVDEEIRAYVPDPANPPNGLLVQTTYTGQRQVTISMRAENFGVERAFELLESVRMMLGGNSSLGQLGPLGLALSSVEDIRVLEGTAGNRKISVSQMDVIVNQAVSMVVTVAGDTYIETVQTTGGGDLVIAGTDVIGP